MALIPQNLKLLINIHRFWKLKKLVNQHHSITQENKTNHLESLTIPKTRPITTQRVSDRLLARSSHSHRWCIILSSIRRISTLTLQFKNKNIQTETRTTAQSISAIDIRPMRSTIITCRILRLRLPTKLFPNPWMILWIQNSKTRFVILGHINSKWSIILMRTLNKWQSTSSQATSNKNLLARTYPHNSKWSPRFDTANASLLAHSKKAIFHRPKKVTMNNTKIILRNCSNSNTWISNMNIIKCLTKTYKANTQTTRWEQAMTSDSQ